MAVGFSDLTKQPSFIVLAVVAAVGWLIAIWAVAAGTSTERDYENRIQQLEASRAAAVTELEELRRTAGTAADLETQVATARSNLEQVTSQQEQAAAAVARTRGELEQAERRLQATREAEAQAQRDLASVQTNLGDLDRRRNEASRILGDITTNRDRILAELRQAQERSTALQQQLSELSSQIARRTNELATIETQIGSSRDEMGRVRASAPTGSISPGIDRDAAAPSPSSQSTYRCRASESGWVCSSTE